MKITSILVGLACSSLGLAAVANPRACATNQCPARCKSSNLSFKAADCWGANTLCLCVDASGKEFQVTL
ncbi:hypothetical protein B0T11DRAFT_327404 [Plectosphaerella cucumerina]|uniref:Extracellular membrane protein CFEM domain-containing protein n=1 Tax=Plectosphaerella cucumerina TaxID=40658 RepID=A0A8K0TQ33_9PEZI|nr:hypothetical protein B0T11DRAFT_327404 [Plectosphaerella cucumerina]